MFVGYVQEAKKMSHRKFEHPRHGSLGNKQLVTGEKRHDISLTSEIFNYTIATL